jgi:hypothetical protein
VTDLDPNCWCDHKKAQTKFHSFLIEMASKLSNLQDKIKSQLPN